MGARAYLSEIDRGRLPAGEVSLDQLRSFPALQAPELASTVRKHWGTSRGATPEERLAEVRRLNNDLRAAPGDPRRGSLLFRDRCATCSHRFRRARAKPSDPTWTFSNRKDRRFPCYDQPGRTPAGSSGKEYQSQQLATRDGRILSGLIVEQSPEAIVVRDAKGQRTRIARSEIEDIKESDVSLMPESLYKEFNPEQLRDLFSFLKN